MKNSDKDDNSHIDFGKQIRNYHNCKCIQMTLYFSHMNWIDIRMGKEEEIVDNKSTKFWHVGHHFTHNSMSSPHSFFLPSYFMRCSERFCFQRLVKLVILCLSGNIFIKILYHFYHQIYYVLQNIVFTLHCSEIFIIFHYARNCFRMTWTIVLLRLFNGWENQLDLVKHLGCSIGFMIMNLYDTYCIFIFYWIVMFVYVTEVFTWRYLQMENK